MKIDKNRSIGVASAEVGLESHVLRFWEKEFPQIKPSVGKGQRRYYFDKDIENVLKIKYFLYDLGYSISGLKMLLENNRNMLKKNLEDIKKITRIVDKINLEEENNSLVVNDLMKIRDKMQIFAVKLGGMIEL